MEMEYTHEEMCSPWKYGCNDETFEDDDCIESGSEWEEDSKNPFPIPEKLRRPGGSMLRSLIPEDSLRHSHFGEYLERMRETFKVERLEDSTIEYVVSTTKKFLEFVSRNINQFPDNNGINHQVMIVFVLVNSVCLFRWSQNMSLLSRKEVSKIQQLSIT